MISTVAPYLILAACLVGMFWYIRRDSRKIGALGANEDALKKELEDAQKAKEISDSVDNMPAAEFDSLREKLNSRK